MTTTQHIYVVDDEAPAREMVGDYLKLHGFDVTLCDGGASLRAAIARQSPDLIILDLNMPEEDGLSIVRALKQHGSVPIIMLTATASPIDRVVGLELGADDYLAKPCELRELLARVRSVLRRGPKQAAETLKVGDLEIEPRRRRVSRGDKKIDLTAKEYALLDYLVRNAGEVLSRTLIAEHVWDMNFDSDTNVVDVAMRRLRAKVDDPFDVKLIRTIRGVGYLLEGPAA